MVFLVLLLFLLLMMMMGMEVGVLCVVVGKEDGSLEEWTD